MTERRKIAAILAADVVGFSRMASTDEDRTLARLRVLHADVIDPIIASQNGRVFKRTGDGALVEFRSVVEAVRCAISVQNAMAERHVGTPEDQRIVFRIGIHLGDVVEESDGDLMGDGVNIAARLEGIAKPGAICLSEDAYRQVKGRLDLEVTDLGPTQLKNIIQPIRVYQLQVGAPAQAKSMAPVVSSAPTKSAEGDRRRWLAMLGALTAASVIVAVSIWYFLAATRSTTVATKAPAEAARLSIVVLPFNNLSGDPGQDYLVDALTDELTTGVARLHGSFVIARNTAMTYKGKPVDAKAIGKDLGVRYVLEGSVQQSGAEMRVNAQLIDSDSGAHLWAEQFDTPRADLLQTQDQIVALLARALEVQLAQAEAARFKRTPAANPDAEDLALQCQAGVQKGGYVGKEADAGYRLCEQALAADPANVRALDWLSNKFYVPVLIGVSVDPKTDLERADKLVSKGLASDPNDASLHADKGYVLYAQGRLDEAITEYETAFALAPAMVAAQGGLGNTYLLQGEFEKSLEYYDKAIRLSPRDPVLAYWYSGKAMAHFGLKKYGQAIDWARRAIAINPNNISPHGSLIAALALSGHEAEAHEALQRYLTLPAAGPKTIAAWKTLLAWFFREHSDPRVLEYRDRLFDGLRKAGFAEE